VEFIRKIMRTVVVVGGGFAGHNAAFYLSSLLPAGEWEVLLIDPKDFFENNIGAVRTPLKPDLTHAVCAPYQSVMPEQVRLVRGHVTHVSAHELRYQPIPSAPERTLSFDFCVLTPGREYPAPFQAQGSMSERLQQMQALFARLNAARKVVIGGGGIVGTEIAGELVQEMPHLEVTIVHAGEALMDSAVPVAAQSIANDFLKKQGVRLEFRARVESVDGQTVRLADGRTLQADVYFQCFPGPIRSAFLKDALPETLDEIGRIRVEPSYRVKGAPSLFACGDACNSPFVKTLSNAQQEAEIVARNVAAVADGQRAPYSFDHVFHIQYPPTISLGSRFGIMINPMTGSVSAGREASEVKTHHMLKMPSRDGGPWQSHRPMRMMTAARPLRWLMGTLPTQNRGDR
jgi:NADH dehydrogenase FAD-containing subunit